MTPAETRGGASFKFAALYYLHDRREPGEALRLSTERVAWTHTVNLPTDDPERAWRMMAHTALAQADLKAAAGIRATGRKLKKPVHAFSLSWHPSETPTREEMLAAALDSMKALGLADHQAIIIAHRDTAHPHVHVLSNRVHPFTGIAAPLSLSWTKLSDWALAYQAARGQSYCPERVKSHARRNGLSAGERAPRTRRVSRGEWQASAGQRNSDAVASVYADHAARFAVQAAAEQGGQRARDSETARFYRGRSRARQAIRHRHDATAATACNGDLAREHARLADMLIRAAPALSLAELTRNRSTFTRADLARLVGQHTDTAETFAAVMAKLEAAPELVRLGKDSRGRDRFTTESQQAIERAMERNARLLHARKGPSGDVAPVRAGKHLSPDQEAALRHVLAAGQLANVVGYAGAGKSTMLNAARASWEAAGHRVIGAALSGVAADGLKLGAGIASRTIQSRLYQWGQGIDRLTANDVLVIDEAGMVSSRQMDQILRCAAEAGAKVVLVGDPQQLQAIEAGAAFRAIVDRTGAATLTMVRRQKASWQQDATKELATGRAGDALQRYEDAGMVHRHVRQDDARAAVVAAWHDCRRQRPGQSQIMLAHTRKDVAALNALARDRLRADGALGADHLLATDAGQRSFSVHDRVYFLKNDAAMDVRNGTLGTIERISGDSVTIRIDGEAGRTVTFSMGAYAHLDHGYAATIHKSQGITVDRAHVLASRTFDRNLAYVAMTRHRDRLDLHWSEETMGERDGLKKAFSREAAKDTSLDYGEAIGATAELTRQAAEDMQARIVRRAAQFADRERTQVGRMANARSLVATDAKPLDIARLALNPRQRALLFKRREATLKRWARALAGAAPQSAGKPGRAVRSVTADVIAFDQQTERLAAAMKARHAATIDAVRAERRTLQKLAATDWQQVKAAADRAIAEAATRASMDLKLYREWDAADVRGTPKPPRSGPGGPAPAP